MNGLCFDQEYTRGSGTGAPTTVLPAHVFYISGRGNHLFPFTGCSYVQGMRGRQNKVGLRVSSTQLTVNDLLDLGSPQLENMSISFPSRLEYCAPEMTLPASDTVIHVEM